MLPPSAEQGRSNATATATATAGRGGEALDRSRAIRVKRLKCVSCPAGQSSRHAGRCGNNRSEAGTTSAPSVCRTPIYMLRSRAVKISPQRGAGLGNAGGGVRGGCGINYRDEREKRDEQACFQPDEQS